MLKSEAEAMSDRDLVNALLLDEGNRHIISPVIKDRLLRRGLVYVLDLNGAVKHREASPQSGAGNAPPPWTEPSISNLDDAFRFPWKDKETVSSWMLRYQPWELATEALKNGFHGEGMTNSEGAVDWMHQSIRARTEWRDLHDEGVRFWKAFWSKYNLFLGRSDR